MPTVSIEPEWYHLYTECQGVGGTARGIFLDRRKTIRRLPSFSLAELLVVVVLAAIVAAIALDARRRERDDLGTPAALAFSPDGKRLMAAFENGDVRVWNIRNVDVVTFQRRFIRDRVAFSPDGKTIARTIPLPSNQEDHRTYALEVCDLVTGKVIYRRDIEMTLQSAGLRFSGDGKRLAYVETPANKIIVIDPFDSGSPDIELGPVEPSSASLGYTDVEMLFSPDGETLYVLELFNELTKWDLGTKTATRVTLAPPNTHTPWAKNFAISPDGKRLAVVKDAGTSETIVLLVDAHSLKVLDEQSLPSDTSYCRGVEFFDSGKSIALLDEELWIIDAETLVVQRTVPSTHYGRALAVSPNENLLAIGRISSIDLYDGNSKWVFVGVRLSTLWLMVAFCFVFVGLILMRRRRKARGQMS